MAACVLRGIVEAALSDLLAFLQAFIPPQNARNGGEYHASSSARAGTDSLRFGRRNIGGTDGFQGQSVDLGRADAEDEGPEDNRGSEHSPPRKAACCPAAFKVSVFYVIVPFSQRLLNGMSSL